MKKVVPRKISPLSVKAGAFFIPMEKERKMRQHYEEGEMKDGNLRGVKGERIDCTGDG